MRGSIWFLFFCYLLLGTLIITDYGISMDEPIQRKHGMVAFEYINELAGLFPSIPTLTGESLPSYDHRDYGMLFQTIAYGLELALDVNNSRDVFKLRHLMVFTLFWTACITFYLILHLRFRSVPLALAGVLMMVLSPRIFGDSMYNPKDIPLMCWFIFAFYTHIRFFDMNDKYGPILHGLSCALAIGSRIVGVVLPIISMGYLVVLLLSKRGEKDVIEIFLKRSVFYLLFLALFTYALWPVLWENPIGNFLHSFQSMKRFSWYGDMLYMGEMVKSTSLPWHYIPIWIIVTTPLTFMGLIIIGASIVVVKIVKNGFKRLAGKDMRMDLVALGAFVIPLGSVIILGSVLYNGWRHLYFVYPFLVYLGVLGIQSLLAFFGVKGSGWKVRMFYFALIFLIALDLGHTFYFLIRYHPHQSVYFNVLAGDVEFNFERDYYGVSYKEGLTKLLDYYPDRKLRIYSRDFIGKINVMNFPKKEAERLIFVNSLQEADFFISLFNFRTIEEHSDFIEKNYPFNQPKVFDIQVSGYKVLQVFRLQSKSEL